MVNTEVDEHDADHQRETQRADGVGRQFTETFFCHITLMFNFATNAPCDLNIKTFQVMPIQTQKAQTKLVHTSGVWHNPYKQTSIRLRIDADDDTYSCLYLH